MDGIKKITLALAALGVVAACKSTEPGYVALYQAPENTEEGAIEVKETPSILPIFDSVGGLYVDPLIKEIDLAVDTSLFNSFNSNYSDSLLLNRSSIDSALKADGFIVKEAEPETKIEVETPAENTANSPYREPSYFKKKEKKSAPVPPPPPASTNEEAKPVLNVKVAEVTPAKDTLLVLEKENPVIQEPVLPSEIEEVMNPDVPEVETPEITEEIETPGVYVQEVKIKEVAPNSEISLPVIEEPAKVEITPLPEETTEVVLKEVKVEVPEVPEPSPAVIEEPAPVKVVIKEIKVETPEVTIPEPEKPVVEVKETATPPPPPPPKPVLEVKQVEPVVKEIIVVVPPTKLEEPVLEELEETQELEILATPEPIAKVEEVRESDEKRGFFLWNKESENKSQLDAKDEQIAALRDSLNQLQDLIAELREREAYELMKTELAPKPVVNKQVKTAYFNKNAIVPADWGNLSNELNKLKSDFEVTEIYISAYTDKSGSPELNQRLSLARALKMKERLVSLGFNSRHIYIQSFGDEYASKVVIGEERRVEMTFVLTPTVD